MQMKRLVQKIEELNKSRILVLLDDGTAFPLYKGEMRSFKIKEGEYISEESYNSIFSEVLPKRAKLRAMNLLKIKPYTIKGLTDKLNEGKYPDDIVKVAIDYVSSFHYLDDKQFAFDYISTYSNRRSRVRIKNDLIQKGVSKSLIEEAFYDFCEENTEDFELEQVRKILIKKNYSVNWTYEEKQKLKASLYRKGFNVDIDRIYMD